MNTKVFLLVFAASYVGTLFFLSKPSSTESATVLAKESSEEDEDGVRSGTATGEHMVSSLDYIPKELTGPFEDEISTPKPTPAPTPTETSTPEPTQNPTSTPTDTPEPTPVVPTATPDVWSPADMEPLFAQYAGAYGVDKNLLERIANCESHFNPNASNGDYLGMFQFSSSTWISNRNALGLDPDPALRANVEESIRTAAYLLSVAGDAPWPACIAGR